MVCGTCGYENRVEGRRVCKSCRAPLTVEPPALPPYGGIDHTQVMPVLYSVQPTQISTTDEALAALQSPSEAGRVPGRMFLATVFEERGMLEEAIELLEANAKGGS